MYFFEDYTLPAKKLLRGPEQPEHCMGSHCRHATALAVKLPPLKAI